MLFKIFSYLLLSVLLVACGNNSGGSPENTGDNSLSDDTPSELVGAENQGDEDSETDSEQTAFVGQAVKGLISNALIYAYPISLIDGEYKIDFDSAPLTTRSSQNGTYQVKPPKGSRTKYYYIELVVDDQTTMKCDFHEGCESLSGNESVTFGGEVGLPANFRLSNIAQARAGKISDVSLSPLTHIAASYARNQAGGLTEDNILSAKRYVEAFLNLADNSIDKAPIDITQISEFDNLKEDQLQLGIYSAVFYPLIELETWTNIDTLPLAEIHRNARDLTTFLSALSTSNRVDSKLNSISAQASDLYDANLPVEQALEIITHPQSVSATEGEEISLSVTVNQPDSALFQWYKDGSSLLGETASTLTIEKLTSADEGIYTVTVTDGTQTLESLAVFVSVEALIAPVSITTQPQQLVVNEGESVYLEVTVTGGGDIAYVWQKGGSVIPNTNTNRLSFESISIDDAGVYSVNISNEVSSVHSEFVSLTVNEALTPVSISAQPISQSIVEGSAASFTVAANGSGFLSYQWRKNGSSIANAYQETYQISSVSLSDAGDYDVVVSNSLGSVASNSAVLDIVPLLVPVTIHTQPQAQVVEEGQSLVFDVQASGSELSYSWLKDGLALPNSNSATLQLSNVTLDDAGVYSVQVSNDVSMLRSEDALLTVNAVQASTLNVELSWAIPSQREDGSTLLAADISGYQLSYVEQTSGESTVIAIDSGSVNAYQLELAPGTYLFQIQTVTTDGQLSALSDAITVTSE